MDIYVNEELRAFVSRLGRNHLPLLLFHMHYINIKNEVLYYLEIVDLILIFTLGKHNLFVY